jgi:acyl-CoA thioesterase YciA
MIPQLVFVTGVDMLSDSLPQNRQPVLRIQAMPRDANPGGSIFGGWIMSNVDVAGSIPALKRARGAIVTRAVEAFEFSKPVFVGDLVSCYADIIGEGHTSIKVRVEVYSERIRSGEFSCVKVTEAVLVYVAIDENRRPRPLP